MKNKQDDFYEVLQISQNADFDTIERIYRHLAKKLHPDNPVTGNTDAFHILLNAYTQLSDPEKRAAYDAEYKNMWSIDWKEAENEAANLKPHIEKVIRLEILKVLYINRRRRPGEPGVGLWQIIKSISCPEEHADFHTWYLKEKGWVRLNENGKYEITAEGVDQVEQPGRGMPTNLISYKKSKG